MIYIVNALENIPDELLVDGQVFVVPMQGVFQFRIASTGAGLSGTSWSAFFQQLGAAAAQIAAAKAAQHAGQPGGTGGPGGGGVQIGAAPDPRFILDTTTGNVYRASDHHHYADPTEAGADGVDIVTWANVTPVQGVPASWAQGQATGGGIGSGGYALDSNASAGVPSWVWLAAIGGGAFLLLRR